MQEGTKSVEDAEGKKSPAVEVWGTFRGNEWANKGEVVAVTTNDDSVHAFEAKPLGGKEYLLERSGCESPFSHFPQPETETETDT